MEFRLNFVSPKQNFLSLRKWSDNLPVSHPGPILQRDPDHIRPGEDQQVGQTSREAGVVEPAASLVEGALVMVQILSHKDTAQGTLAVGFGTKSPILGAFLAFHCVSMA